MSECPDFRISGFPDFRISGFLDFWISGFLDFWIRAFGISRFWDVATPWFQELDLGEWVVMAPDVGLSLDLHLVQDLRLGVDHHLLLLLYLGVDLDLGLGLDLGRIWLGAGPCLSGALGDLDRIRRIRCELDSGWFGLVRQIWLLRFFDRQD